MGSFILALDVGSSSVRCSAYEQHASSHPSVVVASSRRARRSVHLDGRVAWQSSCDDAGGEGNASSSLLDVLDECVDDVLEQLRMRRSSSSDSDDETIAIQAVGFTTFVMNLVGVDRDGNVVGGEGDESTLSYACQIPEVNAEVEDLKR